MKTFLLLSSLFFSLNIFANPNLSIDFQDGCPDLSGTYQDKNGESIVLSQKGCSQVSVLSRPLTHTLPLDNQFVVVQDDLDVRAFGRGIFEADLLVLEVKIEYKRDPGIPRILRPVRAVNKYSLTVTGDLHERSTIYNELNGVLVNSKTTYKKQINQ